MSRSGRGKHAHNKARTWQTGDLPPRCAHCRRSWDTVIINTEVHCTEHAVECDGTCGRYDEGDE